MHYQYGRFLPLLRVSDTSIKLSICLLLLLTTLAVFWPVKNYDFIHYDDDLYILTNPRVQDGLTIESMKWAFTSTHTGNWYPLTWLSLMLDYELYGLNPAGYHWTNLLFHIANTLLLFFLFSRMTGSIWKSAFVTALFALHPLHVESVAWISERKDVLCTFFWILTMSSYVHYVERPGSFTYLLILFSFCLGLMAKAMLVTLPFVLLLMDYWPLRRFPGMESTDDIIVGNQTWTRSENNVTSTWRLIYEKIPLIALVIPVSIMTMIAQRQAGAVFPIELLSLDMRVANALMSYAWYIVKMFIPSNLSAFYPHPGFWPMWQVVLSGLLLVCTSVTVLRWGRRYPYLPVGWLWYLGTLVPVIGLVQVGSQAMADRYSYIPLIGLFIMAAWGTADIVKNYPYRQVILGSLALATIVGLTTVTIDQLRYWQNGITLFRRNIATTAPHYISHYNLGVTLMDKGKYEEAIREFRKALQLKPDFPSVHNNLGVALQKKGELQQAIHQYRKTLRLKPNHIEAHMNLAVILFQGDCLELSIHHLQEVIKSMHPDTSPEPSISTANTIDRVIVLHKIAQVHYLLAMALKKQGKVGEAKRYYEMAIRINPAYPDMGFKSSDIVTPEQ